MTTAADLAQKHWNETPLFISEEERYEIYSWLPKVAEFSDHRGERVLEIGCGTGCDLLQFARNGATAVGVDITDKHLELAKQRVKGAAVVINASGADLPFVSNSFDYIYSHGVIHHSDEPQKVAHEILRVLRRGGRFNVHVYAKWSYFPLYLMLRFGRDWRLHIENSREPVHIDLYTAARLRRLFPVPLTIRKFQGPFRSLIGWYLVATGTKP